MKTLRLRPYLSAFRVRALLETQYRGAALGGLVTQVFFALVYIALYHALYASGGAQETPLEEVVTYVWLQQMAFRALLSADDELNERVLSGGIAYDLCRPVDPWGWWFSRAVAQKLVGMLMRGAPMVLLQFLMPAGYRMALPSSWGAGAAFTVSLVAGLAVIAAVDAIRSAVVMRTLDSRGISAMLQLLMMIFAGNVIPLTLFPAQVQGLIRFQPFAQALDAPIRLYLGGGGFLLALCVQLGWLLALSWLGRAMWRRELLRVTIQGG